MPSSRRSWRPDLGITVTDADVDARHPEGGDDRRAAPRLHHRGRPGGRRTGERRRPTQPSRPPWPRRTPSPRASNKGEDWATVAKDSTDPLATGAGDQGFITKATSELDPAILNAIFALPANGLTDVVKGDDGTFRIAQVTRIVPDDDRRRSTRRRSSTAACRIDSYRQAVRADAIRDALKARVVADDTTKPSVQRHVLEIKLDPADRPADELAGAHGPGRRPPHPVRAGRQGRRRIAAAVGRPGVGGRPRPRPTRRTSCCSRTRRSSPTSPRRTAPTRHRPPTAATSGSRPRRASIRRSGRRSSSPA